jgi:gas vesicle protein
MVERDRKVAVAALLIFAGGVVGAGVALLFAPQTGSKTRKDLIRYARKARSRADEVVDEFASNMQGMVDAIGDKTDELLEKGKDAAGGTRKDLFRLIEEGATKLERLKAILGKL